jgi:hypothetical protein
LHSGSLHVARVYAESENITAIQMTLDSTPTAPRLREMLPTLAAIMERKPLIITGEVTEAEVALALSELSPRGLCISVQIAA